MVCYVVFAVGSCLVIVIVVILFPVVVEKIRRRLETERERKSGQLSNPAIIFDFLSSSYLLNPLLFSSSFLQQQKTLYSNRVSFFIFNYFSKLNYWCYDQTKIQKSESLNGLKSGSS
jgi:hypothetical protein